MRLIDADAFIVDCIEDERCVIYTEDIINDSIVVQTVYGNLLDAINAMPTIDAVEVVRCKDCEYFKWGDYCTEDKMEHSKCRENDFCSYAKRKMDAEVEG